MRVLVELICTSSYTLAKIVFLLARKPKLNNVSERTADLNPLTINTLKKQSRGAKNVKKTTGNCSRNCGCRR